MHEFVTLPNGLRILLAPMQDIRSVTCMIFAGAGSRYETKQINGVSHFLEHMFFKGTKRRPNARAISEEIDSIGGEFNAGTSKEYTVYYIKARSKHLDLCLDVLSDMLVNAKFEAHVLEREKGVILEELNMYEDTPMRDIGEVFEQTVWGDQPLGWKTIGTREAITSMTRKQIVDYKNSLYTRDNIIIGAAGDLDIQETKQKIITYFKGVKKNKTASWKKAKEKQSKPISTFIAKPTEQAHICLGVRGIKKSDKHRYTAKVMNVILGANMSSRLFINIRERKGLCYYIRSSNSSYLDTGTFDVQAGIDLNRIPQAATAILHELTKLKTTKVTKKELKKAKEYIKGKVVLALEDSSQLIQWIGMQALLEGKIRSVDDVFKKIDSVDEDQIQTLAKQIFTNNRLNLALIAPESRIDEHKMKKLLHF